METPTAETLEVKLNTEPDNAVPITVVRDEDVPAVFVNSS